MVLASTGLAHAEAMGGEDYPEGAVAAADSVVAISAMSNSVDASPLLALGALVLLALAGGRRRDPKN